MGKTIRNISSDWLNGIFHDSKLHQKINQIIKSIANAEYYNIYLNFDSNHLGIAIQIEHKIHKITIACAIGMGKLVMLRSSRKEIINFIKYQIEDGLNLLQKDISSKINTLQKIKNYVNHKKV